MLEICDQESMAYRSHCMKFLHVILGFLLGVIVTTLFLLFVFAQTVTI